MEMGDPVSLNSDGFGLGGKHLVQSWFSIARLVSILLGFYQFLGWFSFVMVVYHCSGSFVVRLFFHF